MQHLLKGQKNRFDIRKKKWGPDELFSIPVHPGVAICDNPISFPVTNASSGYDFEGGLVDSKSMQLINEAILTRYGKVSQAVPGLAEPGIDISQLSKKDGLFFLQGYCSIISDISCWNQ